jgi:XRE family transcriptional regulator, regulator of sulfur utilization
MVEPVRDMAQLRSVDPTQAEAHDRPSAMEPKLSPESAEREITLHDVGKILRDLRSKQDSSLAAVAHATGLSQSFISMVEAGKSDISFGRLLRLLQHYGVRLADIVPKPEAQPADVVRPEDRLHVRSAVEGIDMYLLTPDTRRDMMALLVTYQAKGKTAEFTSHPGEEFIFILAGTMQLTLAGSVPLTLKAGDSVHFSSEVPHLLANTGATEARMIATITPPTW